MSATIAAVTTAIRCPSHVKWLVDTGETLMTSDGKTVAIFEFRPLDDPEILSEWAAHFRNHYCLDSEIDILKSPGESRSEFLKNKKFPSATDPPGPGIRSGDFGEILVADYFEYMLGFWVPRTRYDRKTVRNESTKGTDVLGFKMGELATPADEMTLVEVKSRLTRGTKKTSALQDAVKDSIKDEIRKGESLNAIKQRFSDRQMDVEKHKIARFQNPLDNPYIEQPAAVALYTAKEYEEALMKDVDTNEHPLRDTLLLITIRGTDLMQLVHALYKRAADEA